MTTFFISHTYKRIKSVLSSIHKRQVHVLIGLSIAKALLDMLGLALIVPLMFSLMQTQGSHWIQHILGHWPLPAVCAVLVSLFVLKTLASYICSRTQMQRIGHIIANLSVQRLSYFLHKNYTYHKQNHTAWEVRNVTNIPFDFASNILLPYIFLITEIVVLAGITIALCIYQPLLCLLSAIIMLPFVFIYRRFTRSRLKRYNDIHESASRMFHFKATEILRAHTEITLTHTAAFFEKQFKHAATDIVKPYTAYSTTNDMVPKLLELMAVLGLCIIILIATLTNLLHTELIAFLSVFVLCLSRLLPSVNRILFYINNIQSSDFAIDNLVTDNAETEQEHTQDTAALHFNSHFSLTNIHAAYDAKAVLQGVDILIHKGDSIGITGLSGAGKTTLIHVLLGLITPDTGTIQIDDTVLTSMHIAAWHKLVGYVPQHVHLLAGSVLENVAFGIEPNNINKDQLHKAADLAGLTPLIEEMPYQWNTLLGENGYALSGGQRQRVAIARALYHMPEILIFDEATNALDSRAEEDILRTIQHLQHQCTVIIVAHKSSALHYCHKIYELADGHLHATARV